MLREKMVETKMIVTFDLNYIFSLVVLTHENANNDMYIRSSSLIS